MINTAFAPAVRIIETPGRVDVPTVVRFPGDEGGGGAGDGERMEGEGNGKRDKFVFAVAFSGWHSAALVVDVV